MSKTAKNRLCGRFALLVLASLAVSAVALLLVLIYGWRVLGWRTQLSASMPNGLIVPVEKPISRGVAVEICEPPLAARIDSSLEFDGVGPCVNKTIPLNKYVVGVAGDRVSVGDDGVRVNGHRLAYSEPRAVSLLCKPLPSLRGTFLVPRGSIWLYGPHDHSFDSRYYGAVSESLVRDVVEPVRLGPFVLRWESPHTTTSLCPPRKIVQKDPR